VTATVRVAIPVKDGGPYLAPAIESVLSQEDVSLRLHVIDNGSSDGSVEVAERYLSDRRVEVSVNERNIFYYGSLNRALARAGAVLRRLRSR
jgi:glycosyltransferase involved in cell wall biosynthesis